ncbi:MAG TPA: YceI family protein [Longimicrobiales bacterium]|nr:YceI family protein [Longimicrobiales bacterium]
MKGSGKAIGVIVAAGVVIAGAYTAVRSSGESPAEVVVSPATETAAPGNLVAGLGIDVPAGVNEIRLTVAPEGNEARYRVREQLARLSFPSDAVGATSSLTGSLVLNPDGSIVAEQSRFEVDLRTLTSDSDRRDGYIQRNTLRTDANPLAIFVPTEVHGLETPVPGAQEVLFHLSGNLTINGVTRPITWEVRARTIENAIRGNARTEFTFGEFEMERPSVAAILSVQDNIRLEYDFVLVPDAQSAPLPAVE